MSAADRAKQAKALGVDVKEHKGAASFSGRLARASHWFARWANAVEMTESSLLEARVRAIELELNEMRNRGKL